MAEKYRTEIVTANWSSLDSEISSVTEKWGRDGWRVHRLQKLSDTQAQIEFVKTEEDSSCFITTACQTALGSQFRDDGVDLQTLRAHRDRIKATSPEMRQLITEYYETAPRIVSAIDADPDGDAVYRRIYSDMVLPTNELLKSGNDSAAVDLYYSQFRQLRRLYSV